MLRNTKIIGFVLFVVVFAVFMIYEDEVQIEGQNAIVGPLKPAPPFATPAERSASPFELPQQSTCAPISVPPPDSFLGKHFHSQSYEDRALYYQYFCGVRSGTYVEIGALDGETYSNTKWYEDALGWSGALIEAQPKNAERLKKNRPNSKTFGTAVCPAGVGELEFMGGPGAVSGATGTMADSFSERWHTKDNAKYKVKCEPLGSILRKAGLVKVDLFSLDVEGAELAVLQTMDWTISVRVWLIELDAQDPKKDQGVRDLLTSKGYAKSDFAIGTWCPKRGDCTTNEVWVFPVYPPGAASNHS